MSPETKASLSLIVARIIYGVNWFNIASIFPLIAVDFDEDVSLLGSISAAFFIGVGLSQIPAGIFAARFNPGVSAIFGVVIASAAALFSGFVSSPFQLVLLRFTVGVGMAFFFSSAVILIAKYGKRGSPGFSIGVMNAAHSVGGIIGVFGWIIVAQITGWRISLILSGVLGLASAILMIVTIPESKTKISRSLNNDEDYSYEPMIKEEVEQQEKQFRLSDSLRILSNRPLIYLGIILIGIQAAWAVELTFIVVYLNSLEIQPEIVGAISSLPLITSIFSAPLIGRFYDKTRDLNKILIICGLGTSIAVAGLSVHNLYSIIASGILTGFFSGGAFTVVYEKARTVSVDSVLTETNNRTMRISDAHKTKSDPTKTRLSANSPYFDTLRIAWVNGLSLIGILWTPIVFSYIVKAASYDMAWIFSACVTAIFVIIPIKFLK